MSSNLSAVTKISDHVVAAALSSNDYASRLPAKLAQRLEQWPYGKYGCTSPVNLLITAAWYKHLHPSQDVCRMWARDSKKKSIPGSFSIRTADEEVTVNVVNRLEIAEQFCSSNSGMQGSRALEKMRGIGRVSRDSRIEQSVIFDVRLFANILNDINDLDSQQAKDCLSFFIARGLEIKARRLHEATLLTDLTPMAGGDGVIRLIKAAQEIRDPEIVRAISAGLVWLRHRKEIADAKLKGLSSFKTAANSQDGSAGDFWISDSSAPLIAGEVKDASIAFGHTQLTAAVTRCKKHPSIRLYYLITAGDNALERQAADDSRWFSRLDEVSKSGLNIVPVTIRQLAFQTLTFAASFSEAVTQVSNILGTMPSLKKGSAVHWIKLVSQETSR
jgi:hypothetical protein